MYARRVNVSVIGPRSSRRRRRRRRVRAQSAIHGIMAFLCVALTMRMAEHESKSTETRCRVRLNDRFHTSI